MKSTNVTCQTEGTSMGCVQLGNELSMAGTKSSICGQRLKSSKTSKVSVVLMLNRELQRI